LVKDILEGMHNKPDLLKKYTSANITFKSWAKLRLKNTGIEKKENNEIGGNRLKAL
jgi:hypothetical protein